MNYLAALKGSKPPEAVPYVIPNKSAALQANDRQVKNLLPDAGKKIARVCDQNIKVIGSKEIVMSYLMEQLVPCCINI